MRGLLCSLFVLATGLSTPAWAAETILNLDGEVPDNGLDHFLVPFDVVAGTVEIEIRHSDLSTQNILDWGLQDESGQNRGWGGGNEEPAVITALAASRSYVPGPINPGTWNVVVGKAKIAETPAMYSIEVVLRDVVELPAQPQRTPYEEPTPLSQDTRWYAGDVHVHSMESGDARPDLDEIATFARARGLDFVAISDHNTLTGQDFFADAQPGHPELLFVPSVEFTTYAGHVNALGVTAWVDHKIGQPGVTMDGALDALAQQGAIVTINHPTLDLGPLCIGCAFEHDIDPSKVAAVEIATGGLDPFFNTFSDTAIAYWDGLCDQGLHVVALGGSDDHKAGVDLNQFQSPIGDATTMVHANGLSPSALLAGIRAGRTVVKLQGIGDPMVVLDSPDRMDDRVDSPAPALTLHVTGASGERVRVVKNGEALMVVDVEGDDFDFTLEVTPPEAGEDRYRAELLVGGKRRVVTSHLWVQPNASGTTTATTGATTGSTGDTAGPTSGAGTDSGGSSGGSGCGCRAAGPGPQWMVLAMLGFVTRRRLRVCGQR